MCVRERGGLALAILVNTYTPAAIAAKRVLEMILRERGYGALDGTGLGGVSLEDEGTQ